MINMALYRRELKKSLRLLLIIGSIMTMYIVLIISMFDPEMMAMLDGLVEMMPEIMAAVGMQPGANNLLSFMISYLYGFVLILFPLAFSAIRANAMVAAYTDSGAMVTLMAAPVHRRTIALTQLWGLISGIVLLLAYATAAEYLSAEYFFPGQLSLKSLLALNSGLLYLHLFLAGISFLASCACSETRKSLAFGAGIPALLYVIQMLANVGGKLEKAKYFTVFSLFDPEGLVARQGIAVLGASALLAGALVLFVLAVEIFHQRDLHI